MEDGLLALERRGISLRNHAKLQDPTSKRLPVFRVFWGREEHWFTTAEEKNQFLSKLEAGTGKELAVSDTAPKEGTNGHDPAAKKLHVVELHEVRSINQCLIDLAEMGFVVSDLITQPRTGHEESRFHLRKGEHVTGIDNLRQLLGAIRAAGEKGLQITRFKGLGEMDAEELRDTTLDPANRTLVQVTMRDAGAADDLFRILMGDKVEPRREFIEKHALDVKNLDV